MKEPSISRLRKKSTSKLKLVCSFNGEFHVRPPSNKLRYIDGETRIVSLDRNISFSKLRSKISDICPNIRFFSLKYQIPLSGRSRKDTETDDDTPLVLIASDEDVKCMVEEYDKLELFGKHARLWVFVCNENECGDNVCIRLEKGSSESLVRKVVLKQHLLAQQSNRAYEHRFIDSHLDPQPKFSTLQRDSYGEKNLVSNEMGNARLHPLNPRDENLRVETNGSVESLIGRAGSGLCNGGESPVRSTVQSSLPLKQIYDCSMVSMCNSLDCKHRFSFMGKMVASNFNRENIMPWTVNFGSVNAHMTPICSNSHFGSIYPVKSSYVSDGVMGAGQHGIHNRRFGVNDIRNHQIYPYCVRNHRTNLSEAGNHTGVRFDGTVGKCYHGLRPHSNISKQGQPVGLNGPSLLKLRPSLSEHALEGSEGRVGVVASCLNKGSSYFDVQYGKEAFREKGAPGILQYGNSNLEASHLGYHGSCNDVGSQSLPFGTANKNPSTCVRVTDTQEDLLTGPDVEKPEALYHTCHENILGMSTNYEPVSWDLENKKLLGDSLENANLSSFVNKMDYRNGAEFKCNLMQDTGSFQGVMASSMDLLYNLSLSSSKEINSPHNSSLAGSVASDALLKPQSKPLDSVDEVQFNADPVADELNGATSSSSSQDVGKGRMVDGLGEEMQKNPSLNFEEKADCGMNDKSSRVIGGISSHLKAFFAHSNTGELQTIKNSDLEYIKELGSGKYGTVFHGKWKGSDVAIKRMKPNCFSEDSLEEDRQVADFWREAHMLGQLHHPNIVAFYGVVTDGAAMNLATVTEYMVNGSLRQVLRRKDRTVDRRKRLIIAMDAAFGMEYLHEKNIVHFDLKSHNLLVNIRDPQRPVCKIGDLGLSKIKKKTLISGGVRGTLPWMAPELLNSKKDLVTEKIDVYSFGVVMWELLTGEEPYANLHSGEIIAGIIRGTLRPEIPNWCDPSWRSLMERCWSSDPLSRPTFSEISKELRAMAVAMNIK